MTRDFRNIGLTSAQRASTEPPAPARGPIAQQRLILRIIMLTALGFLAAGAWLLVGGTNPFPPQTAFILGIALIVSSLADFLAIAVLKRVWSKPR